MYVYLTCSVYAFLMPVAPVRGVYRPSRTLDPSPSSQARSDPLWTPLHVSTFTGAVRALLTPVAQPTVRARCPSAL
jgi:hypothetical protein